MTDVPSPGLEYTNLNLGQDTRADQDRHNTDIRNNDNVQTNNWLGRTGGVGLILEATRNDFRASSTSQVNLKNSMFSLYAVGGRYTNRLPKTPVS